MDIVLPEIDIASIKDSNLREKVLQLTNIVEEVLKKIDAVIKENILLKQEIARLKKQSSPPTFSNKDYSATKRMRVRTGKWKKSKKEEHWQ